MTNWARIYESPDTVCLRSSRTLSPFSVRITAQYMVRLSQALQRAVRGYPFVRLRYNERHKFLFFEFCSMPADVTIPVQKRGDAFSAALFLKPVLTEKQINRSYDVYRISKNGTWAIRLEGS